MVHLGGQQLIEHIHSGGEENPDIGLAGPPAKDLRQIGLAGAGIADEHHVGAFLEEVEVQQAEDAAFALPA